MSRAALWRQENNVKERENLSQDIFQTACEEGRQRRSTALPFWKDDDSFNLHPVLLRKTVQSPYFQKCCQQFSTWNAVIDEIYYEVKHLQPFQNERSPSTAFCLLLRLFTMRMTAHQLDLTLKHADSPYIRGIGFLFLRYVGIPEETWNWIAPYVHDEEEEVSIGGGKSLTIGAFIRLLFSSREYQGTHLPRLPLVNEREIKVQLLQAEKMAERCKLHFKNSQRMSTHFRVGSKIKALYEDAQNPIRWYDAVIDRVVDRDDKSGAQLKYPQYVVTFAQYGNTETVSLGQIDILDGNWRHDRLDDNRGRGYGQGGRGGQRDLYDQVRQGERATATSHRKGDWSRRPSTTKSHATGSSNAGRRAYDGDYDNRKREHNSDSSRRSESHEAPPQRERKRSPEELAAIAEKKRKLMSRYG